MSRSFHVELTTMCMIHDQQGRILVQDRQKSDWPGWTFPGGHVEPTESLTAAIIRELMEETGLQLTPAFIGIAEWLNDADGGRELAALFTATTDQEPRKHNEEPLFWVTEEELREGPLAGTLGELLPIFFGEQGTYFRDNV